MSSELSGVRSSWLMFARNSLLYFELSASCSAFSSSASARRLHLAVLLLDLLVLLGEQRGLLLQLLVDLLQLFLLLLEQLLGLAQRLAPAPRARVFDRLSSSCCCWSSFDWLCSSCVSFCDCSSSSSVRMFALIMFSTTPIDSASWSRKVWWIWLNGRKLASSITAFTSPSNRIGQDDDVARRRLAEPRRDLDVVVGHVLEQDRLLLQRRLPDEPFADARTGCRRACARGTRSSR